MKMVQGYNFPDDATDEEIQEALKSLRGTRSKRPDEGLPPPPEEMGAGDYTKGLLRSAGAGATFGFGDEIVAGVRSVLPEAVGGASYEQALQEERDALKKFRDQYPVASTATELASSIPTMFIPGLGAAKAVQGVGRVAKVLNSPLGQAAQVGAKQGALSGIGGAEGDIVDRAIGGAEGAATGALVGSALTGAGRLGSKAVQGIAERINPERYSIDVAKQKLLQDLERSNLTPEQAQAKYQDMLATGAAPNYLDVAPSLTSRAEVIAQRPGASGEALTQDVINRQQSQRGRVVAQAEKRLDVNKPYFDDVDDAVHALRTNADPLYKAAYKAKLSPDAQYELQVIMDDVNAAFPQVSKNAEQLFLSERNREFRDTGTKALMVKDFKGLPEIQQYDYIMRGLSDIARLETKELTGDVSRLGVNAQNLRRDIAKILDDKVPEFAAARAQYRGDMEVKNALMEARKNFLRTDPEELARSWKTMSEAEKEAYRAGALKAMRDKLFSSADNTDATKRIGQAVQDRREALDVIMPTKMSNQLFQTYLETEAKLAANAQRIKGGSPTARRIEGTKDLEAGPDLTALGIAGDLARGKLASAPKNISDVIIKGTLVPETRANAIGQMLRAGTPDEVARVTKSLRAFSDEQQKKEIARRLSESKRSAVTGRLVGGQTPDTSETLPPLTIRRGP